MSDHNLQLVAADPAFTACQERVAAAVKLLQAEFPHASISFRNESVLRFFDPGSNWSGVACPFCGQDAKNWWSEAVGPALARSDLMIMTFCCGKPVSLNELAYKWPARFGRFALIAMNPNVKALPETLHQALEKLVGVQLICVWQRI